MTIGQNIRLIRIEKDKKQYEIYTAIGVSQSTYSKIENDRCKVDIKILKDIALSLEVNISKLINIDNMNNYCHELKSENYEKLIELLEHQITILKEQNKYLNQENINLKSPNSTVL